jgi:trans-aconitate 2-methyltransferase
MERIREPELMDDPLQARVYVEADFAASDAALVQRILDLAGGEGLGSKVVDLGCGPGNISFRLAAALPQACVLGVDGAAAMLELAEQRRCSDPARWSPLRFQRACLPLAPGALESLPAPFAPPYSAIVSNSLLHHLHDPAVLWRSVSQLAAPGALVVVRDLRRPPDPQTLAALVERHAAAAHPLLRRDFANSLAAAFRPEEVEAQLLAAGLTRLSVSPQEDRYLEVSGRL